MLSKNVGGKFKYLNWKNSEFLAGISNEKLKMKNASANLKLQNANANLKGGGNLAL